MPFDKGNGKLHGGVSVVGHGERGLSQQSRCPGKEGVRRFLSAVAGKPLVVAARNRLQPFQLLCGKEQARVSGDLLFKGVNFLLFVAVAPGHTDIVVAGVALVCNTAVKQNPDALRTPGQADRQLGGCPFSGFGHRGADAVGLLSGRIINIDKHTAVARKIHHVHGNPVIFTALQPDARACHAGAFLG